jgi:hypothetical protein
MSGGFCCSCRGWSIDRKGAPLPPVRCLAARRSSITGRLRCGWGVLQSGIAWTRPAPGERSGGVKRAAIWSRNVAALALPCAAAMLNQALCLHRIPWHTIPTLVHQTEIELCVGVALNGCVPKPFGGFDSASASPYSERVRSSLSNCAGGLAGRTCVTNDGGEGQEQATEDCGPHGGVLLGLPILSYGLLVSACGGSWQGLEGRLPGL